METEDIFLISPCPLCSGSHRYPVRVKRDIALGMVVAMPVQSTEVMHTRIFTCPEKGENFEAKVPLHETQTNIIREVSVEAPVTSQEITSARTLTPHTRALYEAGKTLFIESIETGREFCKFMIGSSAGGVPIYIGLLGLLLHDRHRPSTAHASLLLVPVILFLAAAIVACIGYLPKSAQLAMDVVDEIRGERERLIKHRRRLGIVSFGLFVTAMLAALAIAGMVAYGLLGNKTGG